MPEELDQEQPAPLEAVDEPSQPDAGAQPDPVRHNDRVLIIGKNQSGKTVLARHLATQFKGCRLTFIDPKAGEISLGVEPARSPQELDLQAPVSHYVPTTLEDDEYSELFDLLWFARGPRVIWLDESFGPTRAGYAPKGLRLIVQQGTKHDLGLIACTQRPVNIESTLRTEPEHVFLFVPSLTMLDLKTIAPDIGQEPDRLKREMDQLLQAEGLFSHVWYCRRTGTLHRCAPLHPGWAGA
jgi:hypothetical protein